MINEFSRTELILGKTSMEKLKSSKVAVFGVGGVGSFVAEALARCGIGYIDIFDNDTVNLTNINRQLIATHSTLGRKKVDVMKERILDINKNVQVHTYDCFYLPQNADSYDLTKYDYIVDAIDTVAAKLELITRAKSNNINIISSMGTGNKLNPTQLEVSDIYKTSIDPLARVMRHELKKRNIKSLKVVYSKEQPIDTKKKCLEYTEQSNKRQIPGSISFVPSVAGLIIASEVVKDLIKTDEED